MIHDEQKKKLLAELEKSGNIFYATSKTGISRSTFYRWKWQDNQFKKTADRAVKHGRENLCDIAEHALLRGVKEGKFEPAKFILTRLSPRYKQRRESSATISYQKTGQYDKPDPRNWKAAGALRRLKEAFEGFRNPGELTLEDILVADAERRLLSEEMKNNPTQDQAGPSD